MRYRILLAAVLAALVCGVAWLTVYAHKRFEETDALIARVAEEAMDTDFIEIPDPSVDGGTIVIARELGESDEDLGERVAEVVADPSVVSTDKYLCATLTGCSVGGNGKIRVCILRVGLTVAQAQAKLEALLGVIGARFNCAGY